MAKAAANYAKLAADSEVRRDGFQARVDRALVHIDRELAELKNSDQLRKTIEFYARAVFDLAGEQETLRRYVDLRDRDKVEPKPPKSTK